MPECKRTLERSQKRHQILLFLRRQFGPEHEIEELDRIVERQQAPVMQIRRRVLDTAQRERLDRSVATLSSSTSSPAQKR
jgi:hypothetical protein